MIDIDIERFNQEGYLILEQVVPADQLEPLRQSAERALQRRWPDGIEKDNFQPMIHGLEKYVDRDSANLIEFCFSDGILNATRQLLGVDDVALAAIFMMNNPVCDHGPWWWHRDISPVGVKGPLEGLQMDIRANGPVCMHWNVALYDDDVLWVVPGSHLRPNTEAENDQLSAVPHSYANGQRPRGLKRHRPLPGSVCADLKAGDAVVNHLELFHWGSNYGPKLRRTYHIGYRTFGGPRFFYEGYSRNWEDAHFLSQRAQDLLARWSELYDRECDTVVEVFRAIFQEDEAAFRRGLAQLHPGEGARIVCVVHLCRIAQEMQAGRQPEFISRFTPAEIDLLWQRFAGMDRALTADKEEYFPGFQIQGPSRYRVYDMPKDFGIDEFVASWS